MILDYGSEGIIKCKYACYESISKMAKYKSSKNNIQECLHWIMPSECFPEMSSDQVVCKNKFEKYTAWKVANKIIQPVHDHINYFFFCTHHKCIKNI